MTTVDPNLLSSDTGVSSAPQDRKRIQLVIMSSKDKGYIPCVPSSIELEQEIQGAPSKLTFQVMQDEVLDFEEGALVTLQYGSVNVFKGFVFTKKQDKEKVVTVTAYDQLRYLKNKDIYSFVGVTAKQVIERIANDFKLVLGDISDTKYVIPKMRASNKTLFDIIGDALDHTYAYSKNTSGEYDKTRYVLYDDFGKLMLKEIGALDVPILIDSETAENFIFESTIDKRTYNRVKLYEDNKDTGKREIYIAEDSANEARWGILQLTENVNSKKCLDIVGKAKLKLDSYNFAQKTLTVDHALGDCRVRAGSRIYLSLKVKDSTSNLGNGTKAVQMLVMSAKHIWTNDYYVMDLVLKGGALGEQTTNNNTSTTRQTDQ